MRLFPDALPTKQQRLLRRLGPVLTARKFYLGGGTALALRLGHRRSVDLDWFTSERIRDPMRLAHFLRDAGISLTALRVDEGTLHARISGVQVSWLEYRYSSLQPRERLAAFQCELAALPDLAAMKLSAIAQRGAKKDFVDLNALLLKGISLRQMLAWYQEKFKIHDSAHLRYSLSYFEDADRQRMPKLLRPMKWLAIKQVIRERVQQAAGAK